MPQVQIVKNGKTLESYELLGTEQKNIKKLGIVTK